jgi:hypothetical protein
VAAVITNLADDAHLVGRMQDALSGQMNRRQEMLRAQEISQTSRTTTMSARTVTPFLRCQRRSSSSMSNYLATFLLDQRDQLSEYVEEARSVGGPS